MYHWLGRERRDVLFLNCVPSNRWLFPFSTCCCNSEYLWRHAALSTWTQPKNFIYSVQVVSLSAAPIPIDTRMNPNFLQGNSYPTGLGCMVKIKIMINCFTNCNASFLARQFLVGREKDVISYIYLFFDCITTNSCCCVKLILPSSPVTINILTRLPSLVALVVYLSLWIYKLNKERKRFHS